MTLLSALIGCVVLLPFFSIAHSFEFPLRKAEDVAIGCSNRAFMSCILQLKEEHVQFDRNIVRAILSIDSEAKLLHTCRAYTNVLPCFRDRVLDCGNKQQRELFGEVGRALMFLCSPFSLKRQNTLIQHHDCIARILTLPINIGCSLPAQPYGDRMNACKQNCATMPRNFSCSLHTWMSEQNACTLKDIMDHCGEEAADFYADLQSSVFQTNYPFICDQNRGSEGTFSSFQQSATKTPPPKTERIGLFTKIRLSTKKPTDAGGLGSAPRFPPSSMFSSHQTKNTKNPTTSRPLVNTTHPTTISFPSTTAVNLSTDDLSPHSALLSLLRKLLPIALRSNMTGLFTNPDEQTAFQRGLDLKGLLQHMAEPTTSLLAQTTKRLLPSIRVTPTTLKPPLTIQFVTSGPSVTRGAGPRVSTFQPNSPPSYQPTQTRRWRPWYFTTSTEDLKESG